MHLGQGLNRAVQTRPDAPSTIFRDRRRTWRETANRIARLAGGLQANRLGKGDRVAILALNSDRYFELLFAVPAMGGMTVPLNTRLAPPEIAYMLEDSGATMLFIDAAMAPAVQALQGRLARVRQIFWLDDTSAPPGVRMFESLLDAVPAAPFEAQDDDVAGIYYTGGTTGVSKGVMLTHRNLVTNAANVIVAVGYNSDSVYLHAPPMFHLADGFSSFAVTMLAGVHVFIPRFDPAAVAATVAQERVTNTLLVPTMVNALVNYPELDKYDLSTLKMIPFGASPMPDAVLQRATEKMPWCRFLHVYGMTEAAPLCTALEPRDLEVPGRSRSCGKAAMLVEVRIADAEDNEVPRGTVGEVQVRGPNIMLGYWNKPEQTATALRGGWYHSGDGGFMDDNGYVYIVDRLKDMIISGGENIYSAEVENAILTLHAVGEAAVIGIPDDKWGEAVHAVVVPRAGRTVTEAEVIAHCREIIAHYKCPHSVEVRDRPLPLSGAGKVLKTELRAPFWSGRDKRVN
ncbi:MAG TPA: long-chain fatty acid--CoA ligase [Acetobacteraceae bacterium]|jgi:long-chain acyl-CoA synthetase|nr:long-chain fatty acid--CoA ligase [Acetobacteraceae bacterium]